jgi:fatty acid desaturase
MFGGSRTAVRARRNSRARTGLIATVALVGALVTTGSAGAAGLPWVSVVIGLLIAGIGVLLLIGRRRDV